MEKLLLYFRFEPSEAYKSLEKIEEDSTVTLLDYPFAEVSTYRTAFEGGEINTENLRDGKIYGVVSMQNLSSLGNISYQSLDTLYQSENDEEDPLVMESLVQTGFVSPNERLRICRNFLQGRVRHEDTEFGTTNLQPVRGMQVFALIFGVPRRAFTNEGGFFRSPRRIMIGGLIFTKAANPLMLIKPINTSNGFFADIGNVISNFIIGSVTFHGWRACRDINNTNIDYRGHTQQNLWSHMLNSAFMHHTYMRADNLANSTPRRLVSYAHWNEAAGSASAPMLNKLLVSDEAFLISYFSIIFGIEPATIPAFYALYAELAPDITIRESADPARRRPSDRLMLTMFHELGHVAHFTKTGRTNWLIYIYQIVENSINGEPCGSIYGCGTEFPGAGIIQVGEAWAEFIGTDHARRYHPNGLKCSEFYRQTTGNCLARFDTALEGEKWFDRDFIGTGVFHDLRDIINTDPSENGLDRIGGATIRELYNALTPQTRDLCQYQNTFLNQNPRFSFADVNDIWVLNIPDFRCDF
jgi:hypothetical protein